VVKKKYYIPRRADWGRGTSRATRESREGWGWTPPARVEKNVGKGGEHRGGGRGLVQTSKEGTEVRGKKVLEASSVSHTDHRHG